MSDMGQAGMVGAMTRPVTRRSVILGAASAALVGLLGGCRDDTTSSDPATGSDAGPSSRRLDLPVNDTEALRAIFDPRFAPLGQRVTRIGLYDLEAGFVRDDEGDHLAIYVEPIGADGAGWGDDRYLAAIAPGMAASAPFVFDTWSDIASMDLCQEPPQEVAPEPEPPIETQVFLDRADSAEIDWSSVDLAALLAAWLRSPDTVRVAARPGLESHPTWAAAEDEASARIEGS